MMIDMINRRAAIDEILDRREAEYHNWHCSEYGKIMSGFSVEVLTDYCSSCDASMSEGEEDDCN